MKNNKILYFSLIIFLLTSFLPYKKSSIVAIKPLISSKQAPIQPKNSKYLEENAVSFEPDSGISEELEIQAEAAIVIDMNSKKVLYEKSANIKKPVASLVKMMTAIVTSEYLNLNDTVTVSKKASEVGENSLELNEGEEFTVEDLLYGLILNSANDAAVALAEKTAGNEENFVTIMNHKAKLIGAEDTLFSDSSGLNEKRANYFSTAEDLAKIAYYSQINHEELKEIYKTVNWEIPSNEKHGYRFLENQTNLLTTYPGVQGMKTGYTEDSGLCLVSYANNQGKEVITVVLNSPDRKGDAILLLDFAYKKLGIEINHPLL